jgi:hypothetical protein
VIFFKPNAGCKGVFHGFELNDLVFSLCIGHLEFALYKKKIKENRILAVW